jgi:hypothetical protein
MLPVSPVAISDRAIEIISHDDVLLFVHFQFWNLWFCVAFVLGRPVAGF